MGKPNFKIVEDKLRKRKNPLVLAKVSSGYDYNTYQHINVKTELTKPPKDLSELIYRLLCLKEGSVSLTKNGRRFQCASGRQRSLLDLYSIVLTYAPKTSFKEIYDTVEILKHGDNRDGVVSMPILNSHYCTTTCRVVHNPRNLSIKEEDIRSKIGIGKRNIIF